MLALVCLTPPSGTSTHSLAEQEKSSGKIKDDWMFRLVSLREPLRMLRTFCLKAPLLENTKIGGAEKWG